MQDLKGKTVLLTGASGGIGQHIARLFAARGVKLALAATARSRERLLSLAGEAESAGARSIVVTADITDAGQRREMLRQTEEQLGPVDILVNNAGIEDIMDFHLLSEENLTRIIEINLNAPLALALQLLPAMLERNKGQIVNVSSLSGKVPIAFSAVYSATKAALIAWNKAMEDELAGTGVRTSVICPIFVADAGMHAVFGIKAPKLIGEVSPEKVARSVARAVDRNLSEVLVSPTPMRPLLAASELFPGFGRFVQKKLGVVPFLRRRADAAIQSRKKDK